MRLKVIIPAESTGSDLLILSGFRSGIKFWSVALLFFSVAATRGNAAYIVLSGCPQFGFCPGFGFSLFWCQSFGVRFSRKERRQ